nr:sensor histidine kinase [uncultured Blautia sp.]
MKRRKKWKTLQGRIIIYNLSIVVLVAFIGSMGTYYSASKRSLEMTEQSIEDNIKEISENFFVAYEEMMNIILNCTERSSIDFRSMDLVNHPSDKIQALINSRLISDYCAISGYSTHIDRLMILDGQGNFIQSGSSPGCKDDAKKLLETEWFKKEAEKPADAYQLEVVDNPFFKKNGEKMIPIVRKLDVSGSNSKEGWGFLGFSTGLYEEELRKANNKDTMLVASQSGTIIAEENTDIYSAETLETIISDLLQKEDLSGIYRQDIQGEQCLIAYFHHAVSGILTCEIMPVRFIRNEKMLITCLAVFLFISCLVVGMGLAVIFSNRLRKPVALLNSQVKKIGNGDFSPNPSIESEDELGEIGRGINKMSARIANLLDKSVEDEREKKNLEIKMLQAQINPHFLYNTLDSIRWIAVIQKNASIVKMVTALSGLLKNMAKGFNEKVTLRAELDFLSDYITIEKMRYMEMFDVEIDVADEELYQAKIIKLTLQPLVENAIFSGIEPGGKNGSIKIRIWQEEEKLCISVKDDGVGMTEEKIQDIMNNPQKRKGDTMSGIGLPNVDQRIKLVYGNEYGLRIKSQVGEYTEILVTLPIEYEKENG